MPFSGKLVQVQGLGVKKKPLCNLNLVDFLMKNRLDGHFKYSSMFSCKTVRGNITYDTIWGGDGFKGIKYPIRHHFCGGLLIPLAFTNFKVTSKPAYKVL